METFADILTAGGHLNSLGRSGEVLEIVKQRPERMDELFACISHDDAWVRMRAVDTFEKLVRENPSLADPYITTILDTLTLSDQPSIQWHIAELFTEMRLTGNQITSAINWLTQRIDSADVDWIVAINSMNALVYFHDKQLVSAKDIIPLFEVQTRHKSKTVRKKANQLLDKLN